MVQILKVLRLLADADADCVLVGGVAAASYGSSLVTQDLDLAASMERDNLLRIHAALEAYDPVHRMAAEPRTFTRRQAEEERFRNLYLRTKLGQVDFLGGIRGVGAYPEVRATSVVLDLEDLSFRVLGLDALIASKEAMGRPRDLENAAILRTIRDRQ